MPSDPDPDPDSWQATRLRTETTHRLETGESRSPLPSGSEGILAQREEPPLIGPGLHGRKGESAWRS